MLYVAFSGGYESMDQERLLAAVLLADVVGSTPLYERIGDDAALQQISDCLDAIREVVARHGGDFIYSKGDDVLSLFESAEAALKAVCQISSQLTARYSATLSMSPQGCPPRPTPGRC